MSLSASSFDLVVFDCDGVLVDSEIISCRTHADVLTSAGYPITAEEVHARFLGRSSREARIEIEADLGRALPDDFDSQLHDVLFRDFRSSLQQIPGMAGTLADLTIPVCVASSGSPERIRLALELVGLHERFAPHIFSASQVANGKPAPDLFLFAAEQMQAQPARCVVIEDSVAGVIGAQRAGMTVLGFHGGSHCGPDSADALLYAGAAATFADMRQLPMLLERSGYAGASA